MRPGFGLTTTGLRAACSSGRSSLLSEQAASTGLAQLASATHPHLHAVMAMTHRDNRAVFRAGCGADDRQVRIRQEGPDRARKFRRVRNEQGSRAMADGASPGSFARAESIRRLAAQPSNISIAARSSYHARIRNRVDRATTSAQ
jgi:hypothetical protein